jgi:hypothetical protein
MSGPPHDSFPSCRRSSLASAEAQQNGGFAALARNSETHDRNSNKRFEPYRSLLRSELSQGAQPIFHVISPRDLSVPDSLNIDCHDAKAFSRRWQAEEIMSRRSPNLATYDNAISRYEHLLDVELHVRDRVRKITDHLDRGIAAPTLTG